MNNSRISRRSFIRVLAGLFAFIPAARSLTALPFNSDDGSPTILSREDLKETLKNKIAKGKVLALGGDSIWIRDRYADKLRLVITNESIVWKGKYNKGKGFDSYSHAIEPGDDVIALGQRNGGDFAVERMYANILNTYIKVDEISRDQDGVTIYYTDASRKRSTVKVRPDYLIDQALFEEIVRKRQQLLDVTVQVIGLPLKDGTIIAANILF